MDAGGLVVGDGAVEDAKAKDGVALLAAHLRSGLPTVGGAGDGVSDGMLRRRTVPLTRRLDGAGDDVVQLRDVMWPPLGGRIDDGHVRGHPLHVVGGIGNGAAVDVVGGVVGNAAGDVVGGFVSIAAGDVVDLATTCVDGGTTTFAGGSISFGGGSRW